MKFIKLDNDYIDLSKVVGVSFLDDEFTIYFFSPGFDDYRMNIKFDCYKNYIRNKRVLISELIKVSLFDDCEVVEC